jgi:DNA repair exonuclease SbcCD ATPase subunit
MEFDVKKKIAELKNSIEELDSQLGQIYSRIDALECYPGNQSNVDELNDESNSIEDSKKKLVEELNELERLDKIKDSSLTRIEILEKEKKELEDELDILEKSGKNDRLGIVIFQLGAIKQEIAYYQQQVKNVNKKRY